MDITVVGAGVVGLTTAFVLQERGHRVHVVGAEPASRTVSSAAGAIWMPYQVGPRTRVVHWANTTRAWLEQLPHAAGIDVLDAYEITADPPWWDAEAVRTPAPVRGAPLAWRFRAPRAEPALHLAYLAERLSIARRTVTDLAAEPGDAVINCTGLGARALCADAALEPLFGQVVIAGVGGCDRHISITDDRDPDALFYIIPRRGEVVLGGCALRGRDAAEDPAITARILAHAAALDLPMGEVRAVRTGLRPFRPEVRLEREGRVIHDYGHGGAGFTLAYGCALEVDQLLRS